jgi:hypothetical protein
MSAAVYLLCTATSGLCALLLLRSYGKNGMRLLLWSGLCFIGLTLDNAVLFFDLVVFPETNLALLRRAGAFVGLSLLIYGLIWDTK